MSPISKIYLTSGFFIFSFSACIRDTKLQKKIIGNWELRAGERNNQRQESLKGIYINFTNDSVATNFNATVSPETVLYKIDGNKIIQKDDTPIEYLIEEQTDSTMQLYTEMRGSGFRLFLKKT